jgi:hypothetical protein
MTRLLLLAAVTLTLVGCRHSCGNHCSMLDRSGCEPKATPVSYNGPVTTYPASLNNGLSTPVTAVPTGFPVIPPPNPNAVELPFPTETIPPPGLPVSGIAPNGARSVGLPK